jgi:hypothetical protein
VFRDLIRIFGYPPTKTNATLSELYTAEADFNFNVGTTHKETFQTVLSIKSSDWFQFN